ncbi:MAG: SagB/ThcOx family dehydrogenase [Tatlockia sp.]|nr:SagB/ThcOx family dehydrogenase [Tatlockia sp.]
MKLDEQDEQSQILEQATYSNNYSPFIPWANSIGFKINSFRYQEHSLSMRLAEDFLANLGFTRDNVESECSIQTYFDDIGKTLLSFPSLEDNQQFKKINLAKTAPLKLSLENLIKNRRSIRHYTGDSVSLDYVASIVKAGIGVTSTCEVSLGKNSSTSLSLKAAPSAGGIYPVELYLVSLNIDKLEKGIYQYNPSEDCLVKLYQHETVNKLLECFSVTEDLISIKRAAFICLLIGSAPKLMYKYGNRGVGFTIHEVGSISQNIHLAVTSLGLGSVDCASYFNDEAHRVLNIDGIYRHLFHTIVIGVSQ